MKRIYKKLNSARGASILFATLVFMLCAFAGAAALTAAAANAGRFSHAEQDQQKYLSVASAADLLLDELSTPRLELTRTHTETRTWDTSTSEPPKTSYSAPTDTQIIWYDGKNPLDNQDFLLRKLVEDDCKGLFEAKVVPSDWYTSASPTPIPVPDPPVCAAKQLTISGDADMKNLGYVYAEVSLDPESYDLIIHLWAGDAPKAEPGEGTGETKKAYETEIRLPARMSTNIRSTVVENSGSDSKGWTITETAAVFTLEWPIDGALITRI